MFLAPNFFCGQILKRLDRDYKSRPRSDHCTKFHADRPTHLGDLALKRSEKTSALKHKSAPKTIVSGRTNKLTFWIAASQARWNQIHRRLEPTSAKQMTSAHANN